MTIATQNASIATLTPARAFETALAAAHAVGANVFALFSHADENPVLAIGLGLLAFIFTAMGVYLALTRHASREQRLKRLFAWCVVPPTVLFSWTLIGMFPAALAGFIVWGLLVMLTEGILLGGDSRARTAVWCALAAMATQHTPLAAIVIAPILAHVMWVAWTEGAKRRTVIACVAASQALLGALLWPLVL